MLGFLLFWWMALIGWLSKEIALPGKLLKCSTNRSLLQGGYFAFFIKVFCMQESKTLKMIT